MKTLYVNGCSFVSDHTVNNDNLYPSILAKKLKTNIVNKGMPGCCNRRIIRTTVKDSMCFDSDTFVLISLTQTVRTEKNVRENWDPQDPMMIDEDFFQSIKPNTQDNHLRPYGDWFLKYFDETAEILNLATDVVMLSGYLKSLSVPHLIYSHRPMVNNLNLHNHTILDSMVKRAEVLNFLKTNFCDLIQANQKDFYDGIYGHFNEQGHAKAASYLENLINSSH
jgi:hypothetical protein